MKKIITYKDIYLRITFQGAYECSCVFNGQYIKCDYIGYTKKRAIKTFYKMINSK